MKHLLLLLCFLSIAGIAAAQDKIYTTTQKAPIEGEVTEITVNEIKYHPTGRPNPVVSLDKQDVVKIVYQNGEVFMINNPLKDFTIYGNQKKWNAKLDMLTPLMGHTRLYLEQALKPGRSSEYELNIIGLGKNPINNNEYMSYNGYYKPVYFNARGIGLGYGMKFLRLPDYVNGQVRLRHILQGSYIKPAVSLAYYTRTFVGTDQLGIPYLTRKPVFAANVNTTFGKQWILDNTISLEVYGTVGYGFDNVRANQRKINHDVNQGYFFVEDNSPFNAFGYTRFSSGDFGLALSGGFRLGYLFNIKKKKTAQ